MVNVDQPNNFKRLHKEKYNEESDEGYFLEVDIQLLERLHEPHNDLGRKACS